MRICICSDIHGNGAAFLSFIKDIRKRNIDLIVFCGDIFGYYYESNEILTWIRKQKNWICLLGNHEKMLLDTIDGLQSEDYLIQKYGNSYLKIKERVSKENVEFLRQLKTMHNLAVDGLVLSFFHGGPIDHLNMRIYPNTNLNQIGLIDSIKNLNYVFCGHTHYKMCRKIENVIIANPGSLGQQRDGKGVSYIIFNTIDRKMDFYTFNYNVEYIVQSIKKNETNKQIMDKLLEVLYRIR